MEKNNERIYQEFERRNRQAELGGGEDKLRKRHEAGRMRSEEHTSELQSPTNLVCRLLLEKNFFNDTATTEIYTLSLHDALPILK